MKALDIIIRGSACPIRAIAVALYSKQEASFFTLPIEDRRNYRAKYDLLSADKQEAFKKEAIKLHVEGRKIVAAKASDAKKEFSRKTNELRQYHVTEAGNGARTCYIKFRDESEVVVTPRGKAIVEKIGKEGVQKEIAKTLGKLGNAERKSAVDAMADSGITVNVRKTEPGKFTLTPTATRLLAKVGKK